MANLDLVIEEAQELACKSMPLIVYGMTACHLRKTDCVYYDGKYSAVRAETVSSNPSNDVPSYPGCGFGTSRVTNVIVSED